MLSEKLISVEKYSITYILHLVVSTLTDQSDPPHHPLHSWFFSPVTLLETSEYAATRIIQPINIPGEFRQNPENSFSGEIFRHSRYQAYAVGRSNFKFSPRNSQST